ncbi:MAG: hypothetical protein M3Z98_11170, partial [Candidatus Dormibacteraeota bacterium]|nr:hypothetical protein [Candidatus Dormibacteraeota bacterium]
MTLDLGRILGRTFSITWRHKWLWLLGVVGGGSFGFRANFPGGGGGRGNTSSAQVQHFLNDWAWLIILVVAVLLLVVLVTFILSCIAIPAATWAALALDAGEPATLGSAWRQGVRRFWVYVRLALLKLAIGLAVGIVAGALVLIGLLIFASAGKGSLLVLVPLAILLVLAFIAVAIALAFLFAWSERMPVLLGVGAVDALRTSARVARGAWVDTLVFAIVMGLVAGFIGLGVLVVAVVFAIPGIVIAFAGLAAGSSLAIGIGVVLALVLGGAVLIIGGGFVGALVQVGYA